MDTSGDIRTVAPLVDLVKKTIEEKMLSLRMRLKL
jgi:hypothetical protein